MPGYPRTSTPSSYEGDHPFKPNGEFAVRPLGMAILDLLSVVLLVVFVVLLSSTLIMLFVYLWLSAYCYGCTVVRPYGRYVVWLYERYATTQLLSNCQQVFPTRHWNPETLEPRAVRRTLEPRDIGTPGKCTRWGKGPDPRTVKGHRPKERP